MRGTSWLRGCSSHHEDFIPHLQPIPGAGIFGNPGCFPDARKTRQVPARRLAGLSTPTLVAPQARPPAQHLSPRAALLLAHPTCLQLCGGQERGKARQKNKAPNPARSSEGVTLGYCTRVTKIRPSRKHDYLLMPCFSAKPYPVFLGLTFSPSILGLVNYQRIFSRHLS